MDYFLKNELSDSYMLLQENVPSHLMGMDGLHTESTSESSEAILDNNRMQEDRQIFRLGIHNMVFNGKHQEVKQLDGYISQVEDASMSGHASGFDSCATTNKGVVDNDFRGHKDDILM